MAECTQFKAAVSQMATFCMTHRSLYQRSGLKVSDGVQSFIDYSQSSLFKTVKSKYFLLTTRLPS